MSETTLNAIADRLRASGFRVSVEYPGWLAIQRTNDRRVYVAGNADLSWAIEIYSGPEGLESGDRCVECLTLSGLPSAFDDARIIGDAIAQTIQTTSLP